MTGLTTSLRAAAAAGAAAAITGAAAGLIDPIRTNHLSGALEKAQPAMLIPLAIAVTAVAALLIRRAGAATRTSRTGVSLTAIGAAGDVLAAIASLLTSKDHVLGPLFVIAAVLSVLGLVLVAITIARSGVPPRWSGIALAAGWLIGGPLGPPRHRPRTGGHPPGHRRRRAGTTTRTSAAHSARLGPT
jgi:hypothetical protein